jgi:phage gpG-like protein
VAGLELRIESFGDVQLSRRMLRFGENVGDLSPAFRQIVDDFAKLGFDQFASEGRKASGGWAPLAASTIARKGHDTILSATGDLETSLTGTQDGGLRRVHITDDEMEYLSLVPYAGYHQTGTARMPRRRPFELRARDRASVVKRLQRHIVEGLRT